MPNSPFIAPSPFIILAAICQPPHLFRPPLLFETQALRSRIDVPSRLIFFWKKIRPPPLFTKRDFSRYYFLYIYVFTEMGLLYWWNLFFDFSITKFSICFFPLFSFKLESAVNFYVLLFSVKSIFCIKIIVLLLLILLIPKW